MNTMVEQSPLPSRHSVRTLVEDLVGRDVDLTDSDPLPQASTNVVAVYVNDKVNMSAVIVTDLDLAAGMGGALGMLPIGGVEDAIEDGELPELMRDNCYEVLNVLAAVFNVGEAQHVRLYQMFGPGDDVPADVRQLAYAVGGRMDVTLDITGYGSGRLSVVVR
jgi:hypothetical protein